MRRTYVYLFLVISIVLLIGLNYEKIIDVFVNDPEIFIDYMVNLSDGMLQYEDAWDEVDANGSINYHDVWWINARLGVEDNVTRWHIMVTMKDKDRDYETKAHIIEVDAYTGEILKKGTGIMNYTPAAEPIKIQETLTIALIMIILLLIYSLFSNTGSTL